MANFAIAADENVIARGNKLIEELQEPGEKKGVTLNRLFDLVSTHLQEDQLKRSGVDTEALDASFFKIFFLSGNRLSFLGSFNNHITFKLSKGKHNCSNQLAGRCIIHNTHI